MSREEAAAHARLVRAIALDSRKNAEHGQARVRERIALAGLGQEYRGAAVGFQIGRMRRKPRGKDQWRAVHVRRDVDQRGERVAGIAVERAQGAGAGHAQQRLGKSNRIEVGGRPRAFRETIRQPAGQRLCHFGRHRTPPKCFICHDFS